MAAAQGGGAGMRRRLIRVGLLASAAMAGFFGVAACVPNPAPSTYEICNTTGCGDNVDIEIVGNMERTR